MRIKNWAKFQHFKDRKPPWVKLYRDILDDPDWHDLDGDTSKVLVMLWLIASEDDDQQGSLPDVRRLAFRLRMSESKVNQSLTKLSHWLIQDDNNLISEGYQTDAPETETETETDMRFNEFWDMYPRKENKHPSLKAWGKAIKVAPPDAIISGLKGQLPELESREVKFRPNASTWLNQRRWENAMPSETAWDGAK